MIFKFIPDPWNREKCKLIDPNGMEIEGHMRVHGIRIYVSFYYMCYRHWGWVHNAQVAAKETRDYQFHGGCSANKTIALSKIRSNHPANRLY